MSKKVLLIAFVFFIGQAYGNPPSSFIITVKTNNTGSSNSTSFTIPTTGTGYSYSVDWNNDGIADDTGITGNFTHDFEVAGTYTIQISGTFPQIYFGKTGYTIPITDCLKLVSIDQWGSTKWRSFNNAFNSCQNLLLNAIDAPDLSTPKLDLSYMFLNCRIMTGSNMNSWKTDSVTNMSGMFYDCLIFNQNIGGWNTAAVTNMSSMFLNCPNFNQNIGSWNTGEVTDMSSMFASCPSFNQNIGGWNTRAVTEMGAMFKGCQNFNQNIGGWNTAAVTNMSHMFRFCPSFNQNIGGWNTGAVIDMKCMFYNCQDFNQNIGGWNTAAVTYMGYMFDGCSLFNHSLGKWNISSVRDMVGMLDYSGLSIVNYDSTLIGWHRSTHKTIRFTRQKANGNKSKQQ